MREIYWNVDTQHDFMTNRDDFKGGLYVQGAENIERVLQKITNRARLLGIQVVNQGDWHFENSKELSDTPDFITTFPRHCIANTYGARFVPVTKPQHPFISYWKDPGVDVDKLQEHCGDVVIYKDDMDVFKGSPHTETILKVLNPSIITAYGVASGECVDCALMGLVKRRYQVRVVKNAIKELPGTDLNALYSKWEKAGIKLVTFYE